MIFVFYYEFNFLNRYRSIQSFLSYGIVCFSRNVSIFIYIFKYIGITSFIVFPYFLFNLCKLYSDMFTFTSDIVNLCFFSF